jgi:hypothetical protein
MPTCYMPVPNVITRFTLDTILWRTVINYVVIIFSLTIVQLSEWQLFDYIDRVNW